MTTQELDKMTPEEKQLKIAELCGYEPSPLGVWYGLGGGDLDPPSVSGFKGGQITPLPDYLNSLDAMHEAEKSLTHPDKYVDALCDMLADPRDEWCDGMFITICATASQRADAFLLTMLP